MKKALVISLLVVTGLGLAAFAGPLSGSWDMWAMLTVDKGTEILSMPLFGTTLAIDYTTCGWTFGSTAKFDKHAFTNLFFEGAGSVGAFGFYSVLDFVPQTPSFKFLAGFADLSIAGMTMYAGGMLYNFNHSTALAPSNGIGYIIGGYGIAGDCSVWVEAQFNAPSSIYTVWAYGYDSMLEWILYYDTDTCGWEKPAWTVLTATCTPAWSGLDIYVEYPFACFDLLTTVNFDCTNGFDNVCFKIDDICTGLDWLLLDDLDICFNVQTKSAVGQFELVLADCACFTPYLSLVMGGGTEEAPANDYITGIQLNALTIEYDMGQGVTFKAGTLFNRVWGDTGFAKIGDTPTDSDDTYCWTHSGDLLASSYYGTGCCVDAALGTYDEYFAVLIDGDACCGGAFSVSAFNWFDDDLTASFMDWVETEVDISVGIGSNATLSVGFDLTKDGLDNMVLGVKFTF